MPDVLMVAHDITEAYRKGHELQLQVCMDGGFIDLYNITTGEPVTSWSDEEIIEYQDAENRLLLADIMHTAIEYDVPIKVVTWEQT